MGNTGAMRLIGPPKTIDVMVMRIVTRFTTVDEFVAVFRKFCGEGTCFIPSAQAKRIGVETGFSLRLADGTPMLRGLCVVLDSWDTAENPYERRGVRLGIRSLTPDSTPLFHRLLIAGGVLKAAVDEHTKATVEMVPLFAPEERAPHSDDILPANPLMEMSDASLGAFVDCTIFEDAIPDLIDAGINDATSRIDDDRNQQTTRRIELTERIATEVTPKSSSLEIALAAVASGSLRLDGGTQRIERLESPLARASALADEHADSAFGPMLARAVERIVPVADHTAPTRMPPEMFEPAASRDDTPPLASPPSRSTILGVAPIPRAAPRARVSMVAIVAPGAQRTVSTDIVLVQRHPGRWRRATTAVRGWYRRLVWARRRRARLRS